MNLIGLKSLQLRQGDTVLTTQGTFVVVWQDELDRDEVEVLWLESGRSESIWLEDSVYGPVEVLRAPFASDETVRFSRER